MQNVNRVTLIGRLGGYPELKTTKGGYPYTRFSIATTRRFKPEGEAVPEGTEPRLHEETQWHRIVIWGRLAEVCSEHLQKGDLVFLEGSMRSRKIENQDSSRWIVEIQADRVEFLIRARAQENAEREQSDVAEIA